MSEINAKQEPTLAGFCAQIWRAKAYIALCLAAFLLLAGLFLANVQPRYKAELTLSPANPMNGGEVSSLLANENFFALRYMMQRVGVANASDFIRFEAMIDGASVAEVLLRDENILRGLRAEVQGAKGFDLLQQDAPENAAQLSEYIEKRVRISAIGATPLRRMVYYHANPDFARYFLSRLHGAADSLIRARVRAEASERIAYLQETIAETQNPEHRKTLTSLLLEQERLRMLSSIDQPYAAAMVEPPSVSAKALWPDRALVWLSFAAVGALAGFVMFSVRSAAQTDLNVQKNMPKRWFSGKAGNSDAPLSAAKHRAEKPQKPLTGS